MREIRWNLLKNERIKRTRGVSFDEIINSKLIGVKKHPRRKNQNIMLFEYRRYVWVVPYIIEKDYKIEGELKRGKKEAIGRLKDINSWRGTRHKRGLPARGQTTRVNSRTVRGNVRRTMGSGRKAPPSPK